MSKQGVGSGSADEKSPDRRTASSPRDLPGEPPRPQARPSAATTGTLASANAAVTGTSNTAASHWPEAEDPREQTSAKARTEAAAPEERPVLPAMNRDSRGLMPELRPRAGPAGSPKAWSIMEVPCPPELQPQPSAGRPPTKPIRRSQTARTDPRGQAGKQDSAPIRPKAGRATSCVRVLDRWLKTEKPSRRAPSQPKKFPPQPQWPRWHARLSRWPA